VRSFGRDHPWLTRPRLDLAVAAGVAIALELELRSWTGGSAGSASGFVTALAALLVAVPIALRRRRPAGALVFCSAVAPMQALLGGHLSAANGIIVPPLLLAYGAGAWLDTRRALAALTAAVVLFGGFVLSTPTPHSARDVAGAAFFVALLLIAPWFIGRLARESARRAAAFGELAAQATAESEERERAAIALERARIGHELQDIIAHSVSAMVIQAGGARLLLRSEPERARASILTVEQTGREALADLRRLLGMLRRDDDPQALAPQPGLDQLPALLDSMRDFGLVCEVQHDGEPIDLTPGIDLVGYRVIEGALLSAARNHNRTAVVTVRYRAEQLELEIRGDRAMSVLEQLGALPERVALYAGSLRTLPVAGDGFALLAALPLDARGLA
jgi:signal transduction histidine kinase